MKKIIKSLGILCAAFSMLATSACDKQADPQTETVAQAAQAKANAALQPLIEGMSSDETVKAEVLSSVKFTNAHAAWFAKSTKAEREEYMAGVSADNEARRLVRSPIMSLAELEAALQTQASQLEEVKKKFPELAQLSDDDRGDVISQVGKKVMADAGVSEIPSGGCGAAWRVCKDYCGPTDRRCQDGCWAGYVACVNASVPALP